MATQVTSNCVMPVLITPISYWTGRYELALTDRNMQVKSCLNIALEFWDWEFLVYILGFQKSNISWPHYIYMPAEKRTSILSASDLVLLLLTAVQCENIRSLPQMLFHSVVVLHVCLVFLFVHTFLYKIPIIFHLLFLHYLFIKRSSLKVKATISLQLRDTYLAHVIEQPNFRIPNPQYFFYFLIKL